MNPHARPPASPAALARGIWVNRLLMYQLTKRDIIGRYRGSVFGLLWSFFNPLLLLAMYTFVFSVVFKARWNTDGGESRTQFAMLLFTGMVIHSFFAEVLMRSPTLITGNVSYVKKVVFPLEVLSIVNVSAALFHAAISFCVLVLALLAINHQLPWTVVLGPLVFVPLILVTAGFSWMLASLGVYFRDVGHSIGLLMTIVLFTSPVFYPLSALPPQFQHWLFLNPLTLVIEQLRTVMIYGRVPDPTSYCVYLLISACVAWLGYAWFQKTRKGFANVL